MIKELSFNTLKTLAAECNDSSYSDAVTSMPFSYYVDRVKQLGLQDKDLVLDVGCGFGQWSAALSPFNKQVIGVDINQNRVDIGNKLIKQADIHNVKLRLGNALSLEFEDSSVDILFCYGVVMFMDFEKALKEFKRVLKKGGLLYINSNGKGWWFKLAMKHFFNNKHIRKAALKGFLAGHIRGVTPNSSSLATIAHKMSALGFEVISKGHDGTITSDTNTFVDMGFYKPGKIWIWDNVIEHLSKRVA